MPFPGQVAASARNVKVNKLTSCLPPAEPTLAHHYPEIDIQFLRDKRVLFLLISYVEMIVCARTTKRSAHYDVSRSESKVK